MKASWFRIQNLATDPTVAEIHIIDFIGGWYEDARNRYYGEEIGVTARAFVEKLAALDAGVTTIRVHINSPGGDVFAAANIANALREQQARGRVVETVVDGLAASAASVIAMAGSRVLMNDNALLMIHNPWSYAVGEARDMRQAADELDKVRATIVATYQWHSPLEAAAIEALMDATTWMTAEEALASGFITERVAGLAVAACAVAPQALKDLRVPEALQARVAAFFTPRDSRSSEPTPQPAPAVVDLVPAVTAAPALEVIRACREGGHPELAENLVAEGAALPAVLAAIGAATTAAAAAAERATQIRAICKAANLPELADTCVASHMSADAVRAHVLVLKAKVDEAIQIDGGLSPAAGAGSNARAGLNAKRVYAARSGLKSTKETARS